MPRNKHERIFDKRRAGRMEKILLERNRTGNGVDANWNEQIRKTPKKNEELHAIGDDVDERDQRDDHGGALFAPESEEQREAAQPVIARTCMPAGHTEINAKQTE